MGSFFAMDVLCWENTCDLLISLSNVTTHFNRSMELVKHRVKMWNMWS